MKLELISGAFKHYIQLERLRLEKTDENLRFVEQYKLLESKLKSQELALYSCRAPPYPSLTPHVKGPKDTITINSNGIRFKVLLGGAEQDIDRALEAKKIERVREEEQRSREKEKVRHLKERVIDLKARAAQSEDDVRKQARSQRNRISIQLAIYKRCPYCSILLSQGEAQLDHIYPVSKGGKSTSKNLVFICRDCNAKKSNLTLRAFLRKQNFQEPIVHEALHLLGKEF